MIRAVFDTNVFLSALFNPESPPAQALELALLGKIKLIFSPPLSNEITRLLAYPRVRKLLQKRGLATGEAVKVITKILPVAVVTSGARRVEAVTADPADDMILACALEGNADFILAGDHHLLDLGEYQGIRIVNPATFMELMASG